MFQVQRFTAEGSEEPPLQRDGHNDAQPVAATGAIGSTAQKNILLNKLLEKARSRAKRARAEGSTAASSPSAITDGNNHGFGKAHSAEVVGAARDSTTKQTSRY